MEEEMFELVLQGRVGVHQRRKARAPFISQSNGEVKEEGVVII